MSINIRFKYVAVIGRIIDKLNESETDEVKSIISAIVNEIRQQKLKFQRKEKRKYFKVKNG